MPNDLYMLYYKSLHNKWYKIQKNLKQIQNFDDLDDRFNDIFSDCSFCEETMFNENNPYDLTNCDICKINKAICGGYSCKDSLLLQMEKLTMKKFTKKQIIDKVNEIIAALELNMIYSFWKV